MGHVRGFLYRSEFAAPHCQQTCDFTGHQRERSAEDAPAEIGGTALPGATQMNWIDGRQVIAPETELGYGQETREENANVEPGELDRLLADFQGKQFSI